ncbi:MAG: hypothetical protein RLZZ93_392 [Actinomycetota bacterium]
MQNAANGASTTLMWVGRAAWSLVGLAAPWAILGEGRSGAVGVAANVWGWGAWLAVLVALFVPSALSLTAVRIIVPAVAAAGLWSAEPASVGTALFALVVLSSRDVADVLVQGSAYGAETRFVLRTPVPYLVPAVLVWAALVCATVGGTLLLAAGNLVAGIPVAAAGAVLAWRVPLRLHRLSRRWLVAVPAGLVVHDHLVLAETFMVRRNHLGPVTLARAAGDEADLTGAVPGRRVTVSMTQPDKVVLSPITMRTLGTSQALHVVSFAVAPLRAGAAAAAVSAGR